MKKIVKTAFALCLLSTATFSFAQLPELSTPTTLSGTETTAQFFGGATDDNGASYGNTFAFDVPIDIDLEVQVESSHVNTVGNIFVLISWEGAFFVLDENGAAQLWDQSIENFLPRFPAKTLQASEVVNIVDDVAFGPAGVSDTTMEFFLAYDTVAVTGEYFFNAVPLQVSIEAEEDDPEPPVAQSLQIYTDSISTPIIQGNCIACHVSGGAAGGTALVYANSSTSGFLNTNYNTLVNYINGGNDATLLSKPQGIAQGGGQRLSPSSTDFQNLEAFVNAVLAE